MSRMALCPEEEKPPVYAYAAPTADSVGAACAFAGCEGESERVMGNEMETSPLRPS